MRGDASNDHFFIPLDQEGVKGGLATNIERREAVKNLIRPLIDGMTVANLLKISSNMFQTVSAVVVLLFVYPLLDGEINSADEGQGQKTTDDH